MPVEYSEIATQLAKNVASVWKLSNDEGLSEQGVKELIKASIKPTQALLKLAECYNVKNVGFKNNILQQIKSDLEQERQKLQKGLER